jgi:hypothetical protein
MGKLRLAALTACASLVYCATASASEHQMYISEINWAVNGNSSAQYVEMYDPAPEPFPNNPNYFLKLYDSAGTLEQSDQIGTLTGLTPILFTNPAANTELGITGDRALTFTIPTGGSTLCYTNPTTDIQCVSWPTVTGPRAPESGTLDLGGAPPTDGTSFQRRRGGSFTIGAATPKAENRDSPAAGTGSATALSTSGATLNGTIDPAQLATTYAFDYGKTTAYGAEAGGSVPAGGATVAVAGAVTGLEPGTTYHYVLKASNGLGPGSGADRTFTTPAAGGATGPSGPTGASGSAGPSGAGGPTGPKAKTKADHTRPTVTLTAPHRILISSLFRNGLKGFVRISEAGRATVEIKRGRRVLGVAKLTYTRGARRRFTIKLRSSAKDFLREFEVREFPVTIHVIATDKAKNTRSVSRTLTLTH